MPSEKDRLYVVLYARAGAPTMPGAEDTYHWGFVVGPKTENQQSQGMRYHAKNQITSTGMGWVYEARECSLQATNMLLVRVMIEKKDRLENIMRSVPVVQGDVAWNCVIWVKEALKRLQEDGKAMGTAMLEWQTVRNATMEYAQRKRSQHRFDGQGNFDMQKAATFDLLAGVEIVP